MKVLPKHIKYCPQSGRPLSPLKKWILPSFGVISLIWILIRVIPKPQRALYPCMKVAYPFASALLVYMAGLTASFVFFRRGMKKLIESRIIYGVLLLLLAISLGITTMLSNETELQAQVSDEFEFTDPLGPNSPIGEAKGIIPGCVVWIHNPDATNESCDPDKFGDGYFLDKNANQAVIDTMVQTAILDVSGESTFNEAWDAIFRNFNSTHQKGNVGYSEGEKIFIKINAVHAWNTHDDLSILDNEDYGNVDTSPQVILAVLRQLINEAGVPQEAIYIGDPFTQVFRHLYDKLTAEFPHVHYMSKSDSIARDKLQITNKDSLFYSDRGRILKKAADGFFDCMVNADYLLNIPAIKGHRSGGITFFAKNHFGSNTRGSSLHLHPGLQRYSKRFPLRDEYRSYRVMVDLMAYENLGGKTLIYIGDLLWGTSYEHDPPAKFLSEPFNNDWSSSILVSLDPVAIASVALDILQAEFTEEDLDADPPRYTYVQFGAMDDYLHQAASSEWWPDNVIYDPENDSIPMESLGVHEHWNNANDRQYTQNLGTGDGIKMIYKFTQNIPDLTSVSDQLSSQLSVSLHYSNLILSTSVDMKGDNILNIFNVKGQLLQQEVLPSLVANQTISVPLKLQEGGLSFIVLETHKGRISRKIIL